MCIDNPFEARCAHFGQYPLHCASRYFAYIWWILKNTKVMLILDQFANKDHEWLRRKKINERKSKVWRLIFILNRWLSCNSIWFVSFLEVKYWSMFCILCKQYQMFSKWMMFIGTIKLQIFSFNYFVLAVDMLVNLNK